MTVSVMACTNETFSTSTEVFNFTLTTAHATYEACTTEIHLWRCFGKVHGAAVHLIQ